MNRKRKTPPAELTPAQLALKAFGESLQELMDDRELEIKDFADSLGLSYDTIVKYRNGKRDPGVHGLLSIANKLNISLDRLIKGKSGRKTHLRVVGPEDD